VKEVGGAILGMGGSLAMESVVAGIVEKGEGANTSVLDLGVVVFAEDDDEDVEIGV